MKTPTLAPLWRGLIAGAVIGSAGTFGVIKLGQPANAGAHASEQDQAASAESEQREHEAAETGADAPDNRRLTEGIQALRRWSEGRNSTLQEMERTEILKAWAEQDPLGALAFIQSAPRYPDRNDALAIPLSVLCRNRPADALRWMRDNLPREKDRSYLVNAIISELHMTHPAETLELVETSGLSVGAYRYSQILAYLAKQQPAQAQAAFTRLPAQTQSQVVDDYLYAWAEGQPSEALAWAESQRDQPFYADATRGLLRAYLDRTPAELGELVRRLQPSAETIHNLNSSDDPAKLEVLAQYLPADQRAALFDYGVRYRFQHYPEQIAAVAQRYLSDDQRRQFLTGGFSDWLNSDQPAALAWMRRQSDPELLRMLQNAIDNDQLPDAPAERLAVLATRTFDNDKISEALSQLSSEDPAQAAAWISRHCDKLQSPYLSSMVMTSYLERDAEAAASWVASLPAGAIKDDALQTAAAHWASENELAFANANLAAISNPQRRTLAQFSVFRQLQVTNAAAAEEWAHTQGISPETLASWQALAGENNRTIHID